VREIASCLACGSFVSKIVETSSDYCLIDWMAVGSGEESFWCNYSKLDNLNIQKSLDRGGQLDPSTVGKPCALKINEEQMKRADTPHNQKDQTYLGMSNTYF
jgi:hypothetical protein